MNTKDLFKTSFYCASFSPTLSGELLRKFAQTRETVCTELAEDARKHLCQLLGLCMACDGECVCRQRRLHFRIIEVDHCTIILYHVHLQSQVVKLDSNPFPGAVPLLGFNHMVVTSDNQWNQEHSTSSMPAMLFTASFFKELWSFLSSAVAVLWTTFFFLRAVP